LRRFARWLWFTTGLLADNATAECSPQDFENAMSVEDLFSADTYDVRACLWLCANVVAMQ
jgi:hypothetical protein